MKFTIIEKRHRKGKEQKYLPPSLPASSKLRWLNLVSRLLLEKRQFTKNGTLKLLISMFKKSLLIKSI